VFRGVVVDFFTQDGAVMVSIAHPEALKRQVIYQQYQSELTSDINDSTTTISVVTTADLIESADIQTTCIKIDEEVMRVVSIDNINQLTVERGYEGTIAQSHEDENEVTSICILEEKPLELALKLMLSQEGNPFFLSDDKPSCIIGNKLIFDYFNIQDLTGLVKDDIIRLTGTNAGDYTVKSFSILDTGSAIEVNETLVDEVEFLGDFSYKSKCSKNYQDCKGSWCRFSSLC